MLNYKQPCVAWLAVLLAGGTGCSESSSVTGPTPLLELEVSGDSVFVGHSMRIQALLGHDRSKVTSGRIAWSTSNEDVAVVNSGGFVVGIDTGRVVVRANWEGEEYEVPLRIVPAYADNGVAMSKPAVGNGANCFISTASSLYCAPIDQPDTIARFSQVGGANSVAAVAVNSSHQCIHLQDLTVQCRGNNGNGAFMSGRTAEVPTQQFVQAQSGIRFSSIGTGWRFTCGIGSQDARVYCAGSNSTGQTGKMPVNSDTVIAPVAFAGTAKAVAPGNSHTCILDGNDRAHCWGFNPQGHLGKPRAEINYTHEPQVVPGDHQFVSLSSGSHSCGITTARDLFCWGSNAGGQLGLGTVDTSQHPIPTMVSLQGDVAVVNAGNGATCAVTESAELWCWGLLPGNSAFWDAQRTEIGTPVQVARSIRWRDVTMDARRLCGLTTNNRIICF